MMHALLGWIAAGIMKAKSVVGMESAFVVIVSVILNTMGVPATVVITHVNRMMECPVEDQVVVSVVVEGVCVGLGILEKSAVVPQISKLVSNQGMISYVPTKGTASVEDANVMTDTRECIVRRQYMLQESVRS